MYRHLCSRHGVIIVSIVIASIRRCGFTSVEHGAAALEFGGLRLQGTVSSLKIEVSPFFYRLRCRAIFVRSDCVTLLLHAVQSRLFLRHPVSTMTIFPRNRCFVEAVSAKLKALTWRVRPFGVSTGKAAHTSSLVVLLLRSCPRSQAACQLQGSMSVIVVRALCSGVQFFLLVWDSQVMSTTRPGEKTFAMQTWRRLVVHVLW